MAYLFGIALLFVLVYFRRFLFRVNQQILEKKDITLKEKQEELSNEIKDLKHKLKEPVKDLTPSEIEDFWSKK